MTKSNSAGMGICEAVLYGTGGSASSRGSIGGLIPPHLHQGASPAAARSAVYWQGDTGRGGATGTTASRTTTLTVENHYTSIEDAFVPGVLPYVPDERYRLKATLVPGNNYYASTLTKAELVAARNSRLTHLPSASASDYTGSPRRHRRSRPRNGLEPPSNRTLMVKPNRSSSFLLVHPSPATFDRDNPFRHFYEDPLDHNPRRSPGNADSRQQKRPRQTRAPPPIHAPPPPPGLSPMRFIGNGVPHGEDYDDEEYMSEN